MRILVVAQGLERSRILAAISLHFPNKVIVLRNSNEVDDNIKEDVGMNLESIKSEIFPNDRRRPYPLLEYFDVESTYVDFFDLIGSMADIDRLVTGALKEEHEVVMDISSGTKVVTIAMYLIAQMHNLQVTYFKGHYKRTAKSEHDETDFTEIVDSIKERVSLPRLPLPVDIKRLQLKVLGILAKYKGRPLNVSRIVELMGDDKKNPHHLQRTSRALDELANHGYVKRNIEGRDRLSEITEMGSAVSRLVEVSSLS